LPNPIAIIYGGTLVAVTTLQLENTTPNATRSGYISATIRYIWHEGNGDIKNCISYKGNFSLKLHVKIFKIWFINGGFISVLV
jgi:hypothetical protein